MLMARPLALLHAACFPRTMDPSAIAECWHVGFFAESVGGETPPGCLGARPARRV